MYSADVSFLSLYFVINHNQVLTIPLKKNYLKMFLNYMSFPPKGYTRKYIKNRFISPIRPEAPYGRI